MPEVPGGIAPPARPPSHAEQVEVSVAPSGGFGFFCPQHGVAGPERASQAQAQADAEEHARA